MTARKTTRRTPPPAQVEPVEVESSVLLDLMTPVVEPVKVVESVAKIERSEDGRPKCAVAACHLPEVIDDIGLCGGHYATRPDLRKGARRG